MWQDYVMKPQAGAVRGGMVLRGGNFRREKDEGLGRGYEADSD